MILFYLFSVLLGSYHVESTIFMGMYYWLHMFKAFYIYTLWVFKKGKPGWFTLQIRDFTFFPKSDVCCFFRHSVSFFLSYSRHCSKLSTKVYPNQTRSLSLLELGKYSSRESSNQPYSFPVSFMCNDLIQYNFLLDRMLE